MSFEQQVTAETSSELADQAVKQVGPSLNFVKQSNELARSRFLIDPGLQATRVLLLGISKIARELDLLNTVTLKRSELAQVWPEIYSHKGWRSKLKTDVKNLMTLQHEVERADGSVLIINAIKQAEIRTNGDVVLVFHEDVHNHLGMSLRNNFTKFRLVEVRGFKRTEHIKLFTLLKSYAFVGNLAISVEGLRNVCGIEPDSYTEPRYVKHFFVEPAIKRINAESSIEVEYSYKGGKGRIPSFTFKIREKGHQLTQSPLELAIADLLGDFGIELDAARKLVEDHGPEHCLQWLYYASHQRSQNKIRSNPGGYLRELIAKNTDFPELGKIRKVETLGELQAAVIRKIFEHISEVERLRLGNEFSIGLKEDEARQFAFQLSQAEGWPSLRGDVAARFLRFLNSQMEAVLRALPFLVGSKQLERRVRRGEQ